MRRNVVSDDTAYRDISDLSILLRNGTCDQLKSVIEFLPVGKVILFFSEVRTELSHVTWPKRNEVIKLTLIVFVISGLVGAYVGSLDFLFTKILEFVVSK